MFESWTFGYIEWRWGSLLDFLRHLHFLRAAMMLLWDSKKLRRGAAKPKAKEAAEEERQKHDHGESAEDAPTAPEEAGNVIHNPRFWMYVDMLLMVSEVLAVMFSHVKQCPCHPSAQMLETDLRYVYTKRSPSYDGERSVCL